MRLEAAKTFKRGFENPYDSGTYHERIPLAMDLASFRITEEEREVIEAAARAVLAYEKLLTEVLIAGRSKGTMINKHTETAEKVVERMLPDASLRRQAIILSLSRKRADEQGGNAHAPYRAADIHHFGDASRRKRRTQSEMR